jgi:hypothetical protein
MDSQFPTVEGVDVDDRPYRFPADFAGALTVAAIGFRLDHRKPIESWVPAIEALVKRRDDVRGRAFAILAPSMRFGWRAMRATMRVAMTPEQRQVSIIVFADVGRFTEALGIPERELSIVLIDETGAIRWRATGAYTQAAGDALEHAIDVAHT